MTGTRGCNAKALFHCRFVYYHQLPKTPFMKIDSEIGLRKDDRRECWVIAGSTLSVDTTDGGTWLGAWMVTPEQMATGLDSSRCTACYPVRGESQLSQWLLGRLSSLMSPVGLALWPRGCSCTAQVLCSGHANAVGQGAVSPPVLVTWAAVRDPSLHSQLTLIGQGDANGTLG